MPSQQRLDFKHLAVHTCSDIFHSTVKLLEDLTAISSESGNARGIERAMSLYAEALSTHGLSVEIQQPPNPDGEGEAQLPVLVARSAKAGPGGLLLVGHLDTVLPASTPYFENERLWATGAIDMKGGLACLIGALDVIRSRDRLLPDNLTIVVVPDEETAGPMSWQSMRHFGAEARELWVLEPGQPAPTASSGDASDPDGETLVIGRRGLMTWSLNVHGRSAHAGNGFWQGRSALVAAADWCVKAATLAKPGPGPTLSAARIVAGESGFVDDLQAHSDLLFSHRQTNVVPDRARVEGEARFLNPEEGQDISAHLAALAEGLRDGHGVEASFETYKWIPPLPPHSPSRRCGQVARDLAAKRGWRLEVEQDRRGISFPNMLTDPSSIPTLDGLGPIGGGMHTREEFVELRSIDRRIALLADLLEADQQRPS